MVVRRSEGVLCHRPAGREDDKVRDGRPRLRGRTREDREDGGVAVVVTDRVDHTESRQVILELRVFRLVLLL